MGIFELVTLDSVGSIWKEKIWLFHIVVVPNTWPTRPEITRVMATQLISTPWVLLSTKWSKVFLPSSTANLFHSKTPPQLSKN